MNEQKVTVSRQTLLRLVGAIGNFLKSSVAGKARLLLIALLVLMLGINGMNVANSHVGRYFMSAIENRNSVDFMRFAWLYLAVLNASTLTGALFRFTEERLGLLWREWLTRRITGVYIEPRLYLRHGSEEALSNPDQRITENIRQLTTTTLSFILMIINGTLTVVSFSGVLWMISPKLFIIAVLYALVGSGLAIWLGRPLIVAPLFIQGKIEFGVIGQSAMAFATLLGAFSLIITQFQAISSYASVIARPGEFVEHAERCEKERRAI